jgi:RNA polymerase sigma-70 factor, ECF subfamily
VAIATLSFVSELGVTEFVPSADAGETVAALERAHGQAMFGFIRRQGLSDEESQDAVQETLLRLLRELRAGQSIENPRAWAYRALFRLAMDEHRFRRRLTLIVGRVGRVDQHREPASAPTNDRIAVWTEVDKLPIRQRQVLYLRYRSDLSFDEIGRVMNISASAARSHATQAMAALRTRLSREDFE